VTGKTEVVTRKTEREAKGADIFMDRISGWAGCGRRPCDAFRGIRDAGQLADIFIDRISGWTGGVGNTLLLFNNILKHKWRSEPVINIFISLFIHRQCPACDCRMLSERINMNFRTINCNYLFYLI
jgi:hypothetical protein